MRKLAWPFVLAAGLTLALAALSHALAARGYEFGRTGLIRLDAIASPDVFMPLAALYALTGVLIALSPIRAASWLYTHAMVPLCLSALILLGTIVGLAIARAILVDPETLRSLLDWRYLFALAMIAVHLGADVLRRNALTRSAATVVLSAASLACLYWSFQI